MNYIHQNYLDNTDKWLKVYDSCRRISILAIQYHFLFHQPMTSVLISGPIRRGWLIKTRFSHSGIRVIFRDNTMLFCAPQSIHTYTYIIYIWYLYISSYIFLLFSWQCNIIFRIVSSFQTPATKYILVTSQIINSICSFYLTVRNGYGIRDGDDNERVHHKNSFRL